LKKESFVRKITCQREGYKVEGVPCKFYIPLRRDETVLLKLHPTKEQKEILQWWWDFSIEAEQLSASSAIREKIYASKVYWKYEKHEYIHWGGEEVENIMACEPADLKLTHYLFDQDLLDKEQDRTKGEFWITSSPLLFHTGIEHPNESGGFTIETLHQTSFKLPNGISVVYKEKYRHYENDRRERVSFTEPILECALTDDGTSFQQDTEPIQWLNDFLLILSFAARHRSVYLGWEIEDKDSSTTYYRNNVVLPPPRTRSYDNELIGRLDIEEFMNVAFDKFNALENPESIRLAMNNTIPRENEYMDSSFILLYAALEALVLDFRRNSDLEFIFRDDSEFKSFRRDLKKSIKAHPVMANDLEKRNLVYEKLSELSRVGFSKAFNEFRGAYNLNLDDLWPVVGRGTDIPLNSIRNKIVHGDIVEYDQRNAVWCARDNLRWCVERMILAVLGWPIDRTRVSAKYLSSAKMTYHDWKPYRDSMIS
jgi:hypothetical protein